MKIIGYCSFVNHISLMFLQKNHNILIANTLWLKINGGQGGIRTLGTVASTHTFQACSFDHSDTCPLIDCLR